MGQALLRIAILPLQEIPSLPFEQLTRRHAVARVLGPAGRVWAIKDKVEVIVVVPEGCLLYTSDAADE